MNPSYFFSLNSRFWQLDRTQEKSFTAHETRLFFYLLNEANQRGWPAEFSHPDVRACANAGLSANGLKAARKRLVDAGLMTIETGGHGKGDGARYKFRYHIVTPKNEKGKVSDEPSPGDTLEGSRCQSDCHGVTPNTTPTGENEGAKVSRKVSPGDTNSIYKRLKTFYSLSTKGVRKKMAALIRAKKRSRALRFIRRVRPKPDVRRDDPFLFRSKSEQTNVPFSLWYQAYSYNWGEDQCRRLWLGLTNADRLKAMEHTPAYVAANSEKRFRQLPANYLADKSFNNEIINRNEADAKPKPVSGGREIIRTQYTQQKFKRSGSGGTGRSDAA